MSEIYVGLMSGTSLDAMDAAAVRFDGPLPVLLATHTTEWPSELKGKIQQLCQSGNDEIRRLAEVDPAIARVSAQTVKSLLVKAGLTAEQVTAIGSHGQTIRHIPELGYTLQIGDPNILAEQTGITVVADFRRRDMAAGGQGAPLVPAFHRAVFTSETAHRVVVNIGGISNVSILPPGSEQSPVTGFDTGPGNLLMDYWCQQQWNTPYDKDGFHASQEPHDPILLETLLSEPFFRLPAPKSTGRELFNPAWLSSMLEGFSGLSPTTIQATLCRLTARCVADAIKQHGPETGEVFVCGGGANNKTLMTMLRKEMPNKRLGSTSDLGVDPQWVEAIAFAWLAQQNILNLPGNLPDVTGASGLRVLGGVYPA
ncbi:anhydro-N-acetylmuramic acid kinase [Endozoicomonas sp.]|uniref:anhydro-N-acetylmuramic acid kinase n=1 Tax=Endozoicomonas sp. TaxID=1892382 RepID=UPI00288387AB|nr:anhydro-N-acetylmuramic acid kinase [Endozoicomonas sp.]